MKATSIFGGVQVINILLTILRSKFIAIFLGPGGMGVYSILTSSITMISSLTGFGLGSSAVKNVSAASADNNYEKIAGTVLVVKRLVFYTGLLGCILTFFSADFLSKISFGNKDYTNAFRIISLIFIFTQISLGQSIILQGLRQLKYMAASNLLGSFFGLIFSLPLYYYYGLQGIVPSLIVTAVFTLLGTWFYSNKIKLPKVFVSKDDTIIQGKEMLTLGFVLSMSNLITLGANYFLRIYINNKGSLTDVGLFNAGFAIINSYVGLIFSAMSVAYFPRLSIAINNVELANKEVNQQSEIAILIIAPILCVFLVFINWVVVLLYSDKFIGINKMMHYAALAMLFKTLSWAIAFLLPAKGDSRNYFINELIANIYMFIFNVLGYYFWGLTGLGIAFLVGYLFYLIQMIIVSKWLYSFKFDMDLIKIFLIQFVLVCFCFCIQIFLTSYIAYSLGILFILLSILYSFKELDKRMSLTQIINAKFFK